MVSKVLVALLLCASVATAQQEMQDMTTLTKPGRLCAPDPSGVGPHICLESRHVTTQCLPSYLVRLLRDLLPHVGYEISRSTFPFTHGAIAMPDTRSEEKRLHDEALAHEAEAHARRQEAEAVKRRNALVDEAQQAIEACQ
jgi:hypothetical protein